MRVLMVTSSYPKFPGDVTAPFIESIARGVAARGHSVDVVLPHHPELRCPDEGPVRLHPYRYAPREAWSQWGYAQSLEADVRLRPIVYMLAPLVALALRHRLQQLLGEHPFDVVHAHWVVPNAALISDLTRSHVVPLVISLHGSDVFVAERLAPARWLARRAFSRAGAVTACSGDLRRRALALGAAPERARTVPYGVDSRFFKPDVSGASVREQLGVPKDSFLVLALGRLVEKKGFRHLVEAAAGCREAARLHVAIVGEGDLREPLQQRARELGAPVSLPGKLERDQMAAALAAADAVAVPSVVDSAGNVDGLPNALLEALAAGRPLVASRVAGIPEVVRDDDNGLLVPPGDPEALATALGRLADDPRLCERLGREARASARQHLTWEAAAATFEECYEQAAALEAR